ncbi:DNA translocase FtsK [Falsigemmobacter faecalis]|uniref:DNA translocase FtsK n=1 Tax=Falsigemmobacter faecalis TaxID=2488730 RepID=A0A3P3DPB7_9RHOB|nr:DNA translocase FtsK [Falsigemmobacter faecalis]RRH75536.1 DNA translocase FtsK [Falsigemmobacter faecalis]
MASYNARQRDPLLDRNTQAMVERRGRELLGLLLIVTGLGLGLMLSTYSPDDPGWMVATDEPAQNFFGRLGAAISSTLIIIIGKAAWTLPILVAGWGLRFMLHRGSDRALGRAFFGWTFVIAASAYAATHVPGGTWVHSFGLGGLFGDTILGALIGVAPLSAGVALKIAAVLLAGAMIATGLFSLGFDRAELRSTGRFLMFGSIVAYGWLLSGLQKLGLRAASGATDLGGKMREKYAARRAQRDALVDDEDYDIPAAPAPAPRLRGAAPRLAAEPRLESRAPAGYAPQQPPQSGAGEAVRSLRARVEGLIRRAPEPEPELVEPVAYAGTVEAPTPDRIRERINDAIRAKSRAAVAPPVVPGGRIEPPVQRGRGDVPVHPAVSRAVAAAQARQISARDAMTTTVAGVASAAAVAQVVQAVVPEAPMRLAVSPGPDPRTQLAPAPAPAAAPMRRAPHYEESFELEAPDETGGYDAVIEAGEDLSWTGYDGDGSEFDDEDLRAPEIARSDAPQGNAASGRRVDLRREPRLSAPVADEDFGYDEDADEEAAWEAAAAPPLRAPVQPAPVAAPMVVPDIRRAPAPAAPVLRRPAPAVPVAAPRAMPAAPAMRAPVTFEDRVSAAYEAPPLALLTNPASIERHHLSDEQLEDNARMLESVLEDYGVKGEIVSVRPGPVVTMYELEPAPGLKASRVIGLSDDIARSMSALSARVSTVPGRSVIGIELPNVHREKVVLREILTARDFGDSNMRLPLALGKDIGGEPIIANLAKMPHLLIAGTTGSGKSVAINTMILSLLYKLTPEECRLIMIDPKMLELSVYDGIPHLLSPVVTDPKKAVVALKWVVGEMEERYRKMSKMGVRNIEGYNGRVREALAKGEMFKRTIQTGFDEETGDPVFETDEFEPQPFPYIVVIVDEMADLMMVAGKEIEACIQRLAQMARASGIHLIMATQRPSVDVITGTIKANFPTRISFQVTSKIDSRTILGEMGAEQLLGMGDMLYMAGGGRISRIHGPFVSDEEVEEIVNHLKSFGPPSYMSGVVDGPEDDKADDIDQILGLGGGENSEDALYDQAVAIVARDRKCSTSYIQRKLGIGYQKAARLVEQMEDNGVVSSANHVGKREILLPEH